MKCQYSGRKKLPPKKGPAMPFENFAEPEVAVAAVVAGAAASPSIRQVVRRSFVYGLAGLLMAYDRTSAAARGITKGVREGVSTLSPEKEPEPTNSAGPTPPPPAS
jgi:hypothetical protein